jgi:hypothetical protein
LAVPQRGTEPAAALTYVGLEEAAVAIKHFAATTIMGLVQTAGYALLFSAGHIYGLAQIELQRWQRST